MDYIIVKVYISHIVNNYSRKYNKTNTKSETLGHTYNLKFM